MAFLWFCKFKTGEILQNDGQIQGIVGIDLSMDTLNQELSTVKVGSTGYITLYDNNGLILYNPDSALVNTNLSDAGYSSDMLSVLENGESHEAMLYTRNGTPYYGSTTTIDSIGYTMLGVIPQAEFVAHTEAVIRILVVGIVVCAVLLAAICVVIALSITRPLKRLNVAVGKLADGELDVAVETRGRDEVSQLGENVARIVERLKEYINYIDEVSAVLRQIGEGNLAFTLRQAYVGEFSKLKDALLNIQSTLTQTITSIAQSAEQVNAGADQIATGAQALAQGATEQASSVEELSSAVQDLSAQATDEANQAVEAGEFLAGIQSEVENSNQQMELMRKAMEDISVQSSAIRGIIKTNSATAEESAASQELSGQASMMRQQVAHFKFEDSVGYNAPAVPGKPEYGNMGDSGKY